VTCLTGCHLFLQVTSCYHSFYNLLVCHIWFMCLLEFPSILIPIIS
jgi:hypothetical protein